MPLSAQQIAYTATSYTGFMPIQACGTELLFACLLQSDSYNCTHRGRGAFQSEPFSGFREKVKESTSK